MVALRPRRGHADRTPRERDGILKKNEGSIGPRTSKWR